VQWTEDPAQWGIIQLKSESKPGLSTTPGLIFTGGNSGYAAIGLAFGELGAERIILLGFDLMMDGTRRHWFGDHPEGSMRAASNYTNFIKAFGTIDPAEYGIEIWNVTRRTQLVCFERYNLDDLCADLLSAPALACAAR
jgi:hypothetical protein